MRKAVSYDSESRTNLERENMQGNRDQVQFSGKKDDKNFKTNF